MVRLPTPTKTQPRLLLQKRVLPRVKPRAGLGKRPVLLKHSPQFLP